MRVFTSSPKAINFFFAKFRDYYPMKILICIHAYPYLDMQTNHFIEITSSFYFIHISICFA